MEKDQYDIPYISGEIIAVASSLRVIKKHLGKQCLEIFAEIAEKMDDCKKLYTQSGMCSKNDVYQDFTDPQPRRG